MQPMLYHGVICCEADFSEVRQELEKLKDTWRVSNRVLVHPITLNKGNLESNKIIIKPLSSSWKRAVLGLQLV